MQSAHDSDATYHKKRNVGRSGYVVNFAETCTILCLRRSGQVPAWTAGRVKRNVRSKSRLARCCGKCRSSSSEVTLARPRLKDSVNRKRAAKQTGNCVAIMDVLYVVERDRTGAKDLAILPASVISCLRARAPASPLGVHLRYDLAITVLGCHRLCDVHDKPCQSPRCLQG